MRVVVSNTVVLENHHLASDHHAIEVDNVLSKRVQIKPGETYESNPIGCPVLDCVLLSVSARDAETAASCEGVSVGIGGVDFDLMAPLSWQFVGHVDCPLDAEATIDTIRIENASDRPVFVSYAIGWDGEPETEVEVVENVNR